MGSPAKHVPFTNAAHCTNTEVGRLPCAAAIEADPKRRHAQLGGFREIAARELSDTHLVSAQQSAIYNRCVLNLTTVMGTSRNFADVYLTSRFFI